MYMTSLLVNLPDVTAHNVLLHASDFVPSPTESQSMRSSLDEQEKSIQTLNVQITSLEALVIELLARRAVLTDASTVQKALLSPVRRLAPEILGLIFEYCLPPADRPSPITEDSAPLLLGRVCKRWRRVALGTPRLWTKINCGSQSRANPIFVIPTWLKHSGSLPIDVFLGAGLEKIYHSVALSAAFKSCLQMLNAHFHRCRIFHATDSNILSTLFPTDQCTDASSLRDFRITPSVTFERPLVLGEIAAPNLETMDVCQPYTFLDSITMNPAHLRTFRWDASVSFGFRERSLKTLAEVLMSHSNLEECDLKLPAEPVGPSVGDATITLPKLRRLSLGFPMTADPSDLFSIIDAPALEYLALEQTSAITRGPDLSRALRCLVTTSSPLLREIHLTRMIFSSEDVIVAPFAPLSNVESLHFHQCFLHAPFIAALTPNSEDSPDSWTLPRLSSLCLSDTGVPTEELIRMIECRMAVGPSQIPQLTSISLLNCRISLSGRESLQQLSNAHAGLRINIVNKS